MTCKPPWISSWRICQSFETNLSDDPKITIELVRSLIAAQFPAWSSLDICQVATSGWDNRTFHLGDEMLVRLPHTKRYAMQSEKEWTWLPHLAEYLTMPIPTVMGRGQPGPRYPFCWTVLSYLPGETWTLGANPDDAELAYDLANWLKALHHVPLGGGPPAGYHNFYRGGDLRIYDQDIRHALGQFAGPTQMVAILKIWQKACQSAWTAPPVWLHGEIATGNLLTIDGALSGVIDFGNCGIGDPACDLTIAWTFFQGDARRAFVAELNLDPATWARARGWVVWQATLQVAKGKAGADQILRNICAGG